MKKLMVRVVSPNGLTASWAYDANGQLLQVKNAFPTNIISQYDYVYDAAGRRINVSKSGSAFDHGDTISYGYNARSELTNTVAAIDSDYRYAYEFDDIGNRETSSERGTNSVYTANNLNQYTAVDDFTPQFDDDGNQTLVQTATGIWQVQYNGENRPILWENVSANSLTTSSSTPTMISMSYDSMGRRVTKNAQRFVYDGFLQIANFEQSVTNSQLTTQNLQLFIWDPTEPVATRPLVWQHGDSVLYYAHDGNKNVSEVVSDENEISAHYEYAPFGAVTLAMGEYAFSNPWRFSSEYADDSLVLVYYNYRHHEPMNGRWLNRDFVEEEGGLNLYGFCLNNTEYYLDALGDLSIEFLFEPKDFVFPVPLGPNWYFVVGNKISGIIGACCGYSKDPAIYLQAKWVISLALRYGYKDTLAIGQKGRLLRKDKNGRWHNFDDGRFAKKPISSLSDIYDEIVGGVLGRGRVFIKTERKLACCPKEGFSGEIRGFLRGQASVFGYGSKFDLTWVIFPNGALYPQTDDVVFGRVGGGTQFYADVGAEGEMSLTHVVR